MENIDKRINEIEVELVELRKKLHQCPELGFEEYETAKVVADYMENLGLEVTRDIAKTGVVGLLKGEKDGATFAIRACLDGLAIEEKVDLEYKSINKGRMHACGHDGNMTMVLGAAKILFECKDKIKGNVKFIFQPSEENTGGAAAMIDEAVLENPKVDAIITPHNWYGIKKNHVVVKSGSVMASSDLFELEVIGKAGHGTWPHLCIDPIVLAADVISGLQNIISREVDPMIPALITVGQISGGSAANIINERVVLNGTTRTFDSNVRDFLEKRIAEVSQGITSTARGNCKLTYNRVMPPVVNDETLIDTIKDILYNKVDSESIEEEMELSMGCEEFSVFQEKIPGVFLFFGYETAKYNKQIHDPEYDFNDSILTYSIKVLSEITLGYLK